jgi:transposase
MLTLPPSVRVFLAVDGFDMRGSFDALAGRVRLLRLDPLDGHLYVFLNARRTMVKILFFDRTGYCVISKRLARGTFQVPDIPGDARQVRIDGAVLAMILEGVDLRAPRRLRHHHRTLADS